MARPIKKGLDYFPHDVDASNDEKIESLIAQHGNDGYAFFFILLERIYRTSKGELEINEITIKTLAKKINIEKNTFNAILNDAINLNLFDRKIYETKSVLTSAGIRRRFKNVEALREKWRKKKKVIQGENTKENTKENPMENSEETPESKGKQSKEKHNIYTPEFELFYSEYPRSEEKSRSFSNWKKCLKEYSIEELIQACKNYKNKTQGTEMQFIKTSANFLGRDKFFQDYINIKQSENKYAEVKR